MLVGALAREASRSRGRAPGWRLVAAIALAGLLWATIHVGNAYSANTSIAIQLSADPDQADFQVGSRVDFRAKITCLATAGCGTATVVIETGTNLGYESNSVVRDPLADPTSYAEVAVLRQGTRITFTIGSVAAPFSSGEWVELPISARVIAVPVSSQVRVHGTAAVLGDTASDQLMITSPVSGKAYNLVLTQKRIGPSQVKPGSTVRFGLVVSNSGESAALAGWRVTTLLPDGLKLVTAKGKGFRCTSRTCTSTKPLAGGASASAITLTAKVRASANGQLWNVSYVRPAAGDGAESVPLGALPTTATRTDTSATDNDDRAGVRVSRVVRALADTGAGGVIPALTLGSLLVAAGGGLLHSRRGRVAN